MNESPDDILEEWVRNRRTAESPSASPDFADSTMRKIESQQQQEGLRFREILLRAAALVMAGAVGFLRIELILQFLVASL